VPGQIDLADSVGVVRILLRAARLGFWAKALLVWSNRLVAAAIARKAIVLALGMLHRFMFLGLSEAQQGGGRIMRTPASRSLGEISSGSYRS
jgi:hypothetical protein